MNQTTANPFGTYYDDKNKVHVDSINRVFDENKQSFEYMVGYLERHDILCENEFYVLFEGGVLCKKGRSGVKTSDYLKESVKPINIKNYYGSRTEG